ncbi:hypothetical protein PCA31118_01855 [Pandoraea captiosa]|uniref:Uncharacterized protein n=1 Tax=Pandoraea captiosa TaxID=2508302 RepID=A0A5E4ZUB0_9BURK|nr:hypothetical protein PCA31118_01855 [Pandoraea captiosa]
MRRGVSGKQYLFLHIFCLILQARGWLAANPGEKRDKALSGGAFGGRVAGASQSDAAVSSAFLVGFSEFRA